MTSSVVQSGTELGGVVRLSPEAHIEKFPTCGNTPDDQVRRNVLYACSLNLPMVEAGLPNGGHVMICGGGPSLEDDMAQIRLRKKQGWEVVAINGTGSYLAHRGINPDILLMLDARPFNARFLTGVPTSTKLYLASQCDPAVFDAALARGFDVYLWHASITPEEFPAELYGDKDSVTVFHGAGTTAGLLAVHVMAFEGFKHIHLHGFDSSYRGENGHPYAQPENAGEDVMEIAVGGRSYAAPLWMQTQAARFPMVAQSVWEQFKATIYVHGDGLLPAVAKGYAITPEVTLGDARLICADSADVLPKLASVDAIVTDIPYAPGQLADLLRWMTMGRIAVVNCDTRLVGECIEAMEGWTYLRHLVTGRPAAERVFGWDRTTEISLVFARGLPVFYAPGPDLYPRVDEANQGHRDQKPQHVLRHIIENICPPGGTVLDPFMGSGSTGVAALQTGRKFVGIEREPNYFTIARKRIDAARKDLDGRTGTPGRHSNAA